MILSDRDILTAMQSGDLDISPFRRELLQPASVDLTLSSTLRVFSRNEHQTIDVRTAVDPTSALLLEQADSFIIEPGDFMLGATIESITLAPSVSARVDGRSSLSRLGIIVQAASSHVAPGFSGTLTLEIANLSPFPVKLYPGMYIAQILFETLTSPAERPYGSPELNSKYQNQSEATSSRIWTEFEDNQ